MDRDLMWPKDLIDHAAHVERYVVYCMWLKLGIEVNMLRDIMIRRSISKEEAEQEIYIVKAILQNELDPKLKEVNPYVWVRLRDPNGSEKKTLMSYRKYSAWLAGVKDSFPDVHRWPYNFQTYREFLGYVVALKDVNEKRNVA